MRPSDDSAMVHGNSQGSSSLGRRSTSGFENSNRNSTGLQRSSGGTSRAQHRGSSESAACSEHNSGRSSFALEQELPTSAAANAADARHSLGGGKALGAGTWQAPLEPLSPEELAGLCERLQVPPAVRSRFLRLAVLLPNLPVPMHTLVSPIVLSAVPILRRQMGSACQGACYSDVHCFDAQAPSGVGTRFGVSMEKLVF